MTNCTSQLQSLHHSLINWNGNLSFIMLVRLLSVKYNNFQSQVEQMRAQAQVKMVKKIAMGNQRSEDKRAAAEARRNHVAERTAAQAEYIRQTGRLPSTHYICCGWLS